jgi:chaperonin GroES
MQQQTLNKVKPLVGRVLIQKLVPPKKTGNGLLLPESKTQTNIGLVLEVGEGRLLDNGQQQKIHVKPGQYVLLPDYGGVKVPKTNEKEDLLLYHADDLLAIVEGEFSNKI